jgi:2'-5' RNA ligase
MIRSFVALELPSGLKERLAELIRRFRPMIPDGVNWVRSENLHLTLLFIGDVQPHKVAEIDEAIKILLEGFPVFRFKALGLELFPAAEPRMIWLKLQAENDDIFKLQKRMINALRVLGIEPDKKPLKLHVTIARLKTAISPELAREIMQSDVKLDNLVFPTITLFKSVLTPTGPNYSVLHEYNLK